MHAPLYAASFSVAQKLAQEQTNISEHKVNRNQKYNFTIISNLQNKFMISIDEYYEDIDIKDVSILGSFGYIKTG